MSKQYFFNTITGQFFITGQGFVAPLGNTGNFVELTDRSFRQGIGLTYEKNFVACSSPVFYRGCIICRPVDETEAAHGREGKYRVFVPKDRALAGGVENGQGYCPGANTEHACRKLVDYYITQKWVAHPREVLAAK